MRHVRRRGPRRARGAPFHGPELQGSHALTSLLAPLAIASLVCAAPAPAAQLPAHPLLGRGDLWFAAGSIASVALATRLDRWAEDEAPENNGPLARDVSRSAERLGNPLYVVPVFLALGGIDALAHRSDRVASTVRIADGAVAAGAAAALVKIAVGRARPFQAPRDQDVIRPFSGNSAFPSGHTTLAFGIAAAIDKETSARWVPWVVYPLAGLVGWSRVRDGEHWLSDVVAGAALGYWSARKAVEVARRKARLP
jgi:membrane-associated phospholipid phosphatase